MTKMLTGLTERTTTSIQLNAGVLLKNYTKSESIDDEDIIAATRGGGSVTIVPTVRQIAVDGAPTYVKGLERIDDWVATLNMTLLELNKGAAKLALGGGAKMTDTTADAVFKATTTIATTDYQDLYWVGNMSSGENVVIKLKNALNTNGLNLTISDRGEGTYALTVIAHYDVSDLENAPFEITIEGEGAGV